MLWDVNSIKLCFESIHMHICKNMLLKSITKNYKKSKKIYIKNFKCGFNSGKWFIKSIMGVKYLKKICKISWKH